MAFKMKGFSAFTKTVDPIIGGNKKKKIDPALNQDDPNYSWVTESYLHSDSRLPLYPINS